MAKVLNYARVRRIPEGAVYIGRAMKGIPENPLFKNPFKMNSESERDLVCEKYKQHLWRQIQSGVVTKEHLMELDGKDLVCWCAPKACHGDTILKAIESAKANM